MNVLFIIFNRPETTARVFERIRRARPDKLFIAADGPRKDRSGEYRLCEESRKIATAVDWPCEVKTRFQEENLGCKIHVSSAIDWFFNNVEEGIIIEDDCLPAPSFFLFCADLLERYRHQDKVMHISGTDFLTDNDISDLSSDYRFSRCAHIWGWATWRRAWKRYDIDMTDISPLAISTRAQIMFLDRKHLRFWIKHFKHIRDKSIDTWDAQWQYSILDNDGRAISPNTNLVENIGFGSDATHTSSENNMSLPVGKITLPLRHPGAIIIDMKADENLMKKIYMRSFWEKVISRL
jgi:hypothetical protein